MNQPQTPDTREALCRELARLLAQPDGLRVARYMQMAGLVEPRPRASERAGKRAEPSGEAKPISIWIPREVDGKTVFVRPDPGPFGDHYATRRVLDPQKPEGTRRICFFGESVAAGYLYAPHLTPAMVLQDQLASLGGNPAFEVLDLARTNETMDGVLQTAEASLQLQPDAWVFFMGNNWDLLENPGLSPWLPSVKRRQRYARALREEGWFGPMEMAAWQLFEKAGKLLAEIERLASAASVQVILVIPEVNLADWENRQPIGWLSKGSTARWRRLYEEARDLLAGSQWRKALETARQMMRLDEGAHPTTHRMMALAWLGLGKKKEGREACRAEVDASHYATMGFLGSPRACSMVQALQRRGARFHGFGLVDLPEIFAEAHDFQLPGRELFLDYCHLTPRGMKLAMAEVAGELFHRFCKQGHIQLGENFQARLPEPAVSAEADAAAKLGAAIHSAHRHLPVTEKSELIEYWCREALRASPKIADAMAAVLEARCAASPVPLTNAWQRNHRATCRLLLQHGWHWDFLDADLLCALFKVLEEANGHGKLENMLIARRAVGSEAIELLPFYLWEPLERLYPEVMATTDLNGRAYHRSLWPETAFALIHDRSDRGQAINEPNGARPSSGERAGGPMGPGHQREDDGGQAIDLELVCRLPQDVAFVASHLTLAVNGARLGEVALSSRWTKFRVLIEKKLLKRGINRLTLGWPSLAEEEGANWERAVRRLEQGMEADLFPVFGEIYRLTARKVKGPSPPG